MLTENNYTIHSLGCFNLASFAVVYANWHVDLKSPLHLYNVNTYNYFFLLLDFQCLLHIT